MFLVPKHLSDVALQIQLLAEDAQAIIVERAQHVLGLPIEVDLAL